MDTNQSTQPAKPETTVTAAASPGVFGTNIPITVAYVIAVILFFMPFIDIKCNNMSLQTVTGLQLATGFEMKDGSNNTLFNNNRNIFDDNIKPTKNPDKNDPNIYAMLALGLGVLGFVLSITKSKAAVGGALVMGIAGAGMMLALFLDVKKEVNNNMSSRNSGNDFSKGIDDFGRSVTDKMNLAVDFTPWFYIAAIAFLAAAYFSYKRMAVKK